MSAEKADNYVELLSALTTTRLIKPTVILCAFAVAAILFFFGVLVHAIFMKLDVNTEYNVNVLTDVVSYTPNSSGVPRIRLAEFTPKLSLGACPNLKRGTHYRDGDLKVLPNANLNIQMMSANNIRIAVYHSDNKGTVAELISQKGRCLVQDRLVVDVILTEANNEFVIFMVGDITIGKKLSFASDKYPPLLKSGTIEINDNSFWFGDSVGLPSKTLNTGDTVILPADEDNAPMGLLRVMKDEEDMQGVFRRKGGNISIVKPFSSNEGKLLDVSFFERLRSDDALAVALSISFIVIQVLMFVITFLIRLTYIPKPTSFNQKTDLPTES